MNATVSPDTYLSFALQQRETIRFYNAMAVKHPHRADQYRSAAKQAMRRARFYITHYRVERERNAQEA